MFENYQIEYFKSNFIKSYLINLLNKLQKIEEKFMDKEKLENKRNELMEFDEKYNKIVVGVDEAGRGQLWLGRLL